MPALVAPALGNTALSFSLLEVGAFETTLVVEDGTGVAGANSYIEYTYVTTYATLYGFTHTATQQATEQAILRAMIYLESLEPYLEGKRTSCTQELSYPRQCVRSACCTDYLPTNTIPTALQNALAELAIIETASPGSLTETIDWQQVGSLTYNRKKLGPLETELRYGSGSNFIGKRYTRAMALLRNLLKGHCGGAGNAQYSIRGH